MKPDPLIDRRLTSQPEWITQPMPLDAAGMAEATRNPRIIGTADAVTDSETIADDSDPDLFSVWGWLRDNITTVGLAVVSGLSLVCAVLTAVAITLGWWGMKW